MATLDRFEPITVAEIAGAAALQTRTDRKYVVTPSQLEQLLERLDTRPRALVVDGRRSFDYESVYFDTAELDSYLGAARRRPDRFKVRTRSYLATEQTWIEVKLRNQRGQTVKHRVHHDADRRDELTAASTAFVESFPSLHDVGHRLRPVLTTRYRRSTLLVDRTRVTIDAGVGCTLPSGPAATGDRVHLGDLLVVETKNERTAGEVDRALWALGVRPVPLSKFGVGMAALHPDLPANKWHRTLRRHVSVDTNAAA